MKAFPRDVIVQEMTVRHIGVENELGVTGQVQAIQQELSKRGLLQSIGYDGGGREFRTNPISVRSLSQVRGFKYLTEYYGELKKGTTVLKSGGTHVHISILGTDHPNLETNATAMAIAFHKQFQKISGRETDWAYRMSYPTLEAVENCIRSHKSMHSRTYSLKGSMLGPTHHQTFEFRGPKGSNDAEEILAWVEFLNNVVKACNRKSIEGIPFKQLLRGERVSAYVESLKGWRKLTEAELEQRFDGSNLQAV